MKKVLVIVGPTASGKTSFSLDMAELLNGEIISGDSIQVYRGLDIGSGKIKEEEMRNIPHHLINILEPEEPFSVADFQSAARREIDACSSFPIVCGGTGLYLKACLYDYSFSAECEESPSDPEFDAMETDDLYHLLLERDPLQAEKIHPHNRRRMIRTLTILKRTGKKQSEIEQEQIHATIYDTWIAGCTMPRKVLHARIEQRVNMMFEEGLAEEIQTLLDQGVTFDDPAMRGIGYQEFRSYYAHEMNLAQVKEEIVKHSRQYARRQYTWLNHQMPVHWFESLDTDDTERMQKEILAWTKQ